ncbi:adenosylcobinamide-GDP ribazoletransferase [Butyrivibrio sp. AE2032]|uniref:adenosylcobinamide-GDP ribazoletransferase n=1 Tax=Butyrivibrio sp. AE2032 TaxID=1458463 RepID=UPI00054EEA04|nr:adenosylcobinamide-GDP ribazoletransferase [Butyrivibrio sp. AE2032]
MSIIKSIIISLSLYSKIPMPRTQWDEDSFEHAISFLPLTGLIIGAVSYAFTRLAMNYQLPVPFVTLILTAIPLIITGGFHVDGFMDVQDAIHSYQSKEKKLEIMKDPHIGAFAVISAGIALLIWTGFLYLVLARSFETQDLTIPTAYCLSFVLVRALCGITCISFPKAKEDGMLNKETKSSQKGDVMFLALEAFLALGAMMLISRFVGIVSGVVLVLFTFWYREACKRNFGGVTGDTAGFFVVTGETLMVISLAIMCYVL